MGGGHGGTFFIGGRGLPPPPPPRTTAPADSMPIQCTSASNCMGQCSEVLMCTEN